MNRDFQIPLAITFQCINCGKYFISAVMASMGDGSYFVDTVCCPKCGSFGAHLLVLKEHWTRGGK